MRETLRSTWPLLLGVLLLMLGNGLQGSLLGVRGDIEGFGAATMSWVMSAYFIGFLAGSRLSPKLIARVGHVRVFAALGSLVSAAFILYPALPNPLMWSLMRLVVGFCFAGIYVTTESWLNAASTNETRGQALSLYLIVQMAGIITAQGLLNVADPGGYVLFVIMSVMVSVSFAPILLSAAPAPGFEDTRRMPIATLYRATPLGVVGTFLLGSCFASILGMSAVFGAARGLSVAQISGFVSAIYIGGAVMQFPIGWVSDRMDRRMLIVAASLAGPLIILGLLPFSGHFSVLLAVGFAIGGIINPLYSLVVAHANDYIEAQDMASAAGSMMFCHGLGAIAAPLLLGWVIETMGADAYFGFIAVNLGLIAAYGAYRMTRRPARSLEEQGDYTVVTPLTTPMAALVIADELDMADPEMTAVVEGGRPQDAKD